MTHVLVISGSMGSGKTTVLAEMSDLLTAADVQHAALDLDALAIGHFPAGASTLPEQNLAALWRNCAAAGIVRLLLAEALDAAEKRSRIVHAIPEAAIVACRLTASLETMQQRVRLREPGMLQAALIARVAELDATLDAARLEDFTVDNDGRPVTAVAREVLRLAGWL